MCPWEKTTIIWKSLCSLLSRCRGKNFFCAFLHIRGHSAQIIARNPHVFVKNIVQCNKPEMTGKYFAFSLKIPYTVHTQYRLPR